VGRRGETIEEEGGHGQAGEGEEGQRTGREGEEGEEERKGRGRMIVCAACQRSRRAVDEIKEDRDVQWESGVLLTLISYTGYITM
jgi:hypothetical protein